MLVSPENALTICSRNSMYAMADPVRLYFLLNTASVGQRKHVVSDLREHISHDRFFKEENNELVPAETVIGGRDSQATLFGKKNIVVL